MGEPRVFNMIMLGFTTAITKAVRPESMRTAITNLGRLTEKNLAAFDRGHNHGLLRLAQRDA